jgi:hypothetical protein
MDEKKLNEEDIINGLRCMAGQKACDLCKYNDLAEQGDGTCMNLVAEDTLELISEQKAEIERLTEEKKELEKTVNDMSWIIKIHKYCVGANHCQNRSDGEFELQKQVDELKEKQVIECHGMLKGCDMVKQAVKDTAKEIYDKCIAIDKSTGCKGFVCIEDIAELVKCKGVEVE